MIVLHCSSCLHLLGYARKLHEGGEFAEWEKKDLLSIAQQIWDECSAWDCVVVRGREMPSIGDAAAIVRH